MARNSNQKRHAHDLIDHMAPAQLSAVVGLLEVTIDPLTAALANAPEDNEPIGEQEAGEAEESKAALARGEGVPHEKVLADFGLNTKDFERMGRAPHQKRQAPSFRSGLVDTKTPFAKHLL